jgi:hypothetical protein
VDEEARASRSVLPIELRKQCTYTHIHIYTYTNTHINTYTERVQTMMKETRMQMYVSICHQIHKYILVLTNLSICDRNDAAAIQIRMDRINHFNVQNTMTLNGPRNREFKSPAEAAEWDFFEAANAGT